MSHKGGPTQAERPTRGRGQTLRPRFATPSTPAILAQCPPGHRYAEETAGRGQLTSPSPLCAWLGGGVLIRPCVAAVELLRLTTYTVARYVQCIDHLIWVKERDAAMDYRLQKLANVNDF
jgi:hypothetical protein